MSTVTVAFEGKAADLLSAVGKVDDSLVGLERRSSRAGDVLKGALAADVIASAAGKIKDSIGEAWGAVQEQEGLAKQTGAVITSTGGAANVTAEHLKSLSDSIETMSKTEAEAIHQGGNMLLTFTNIKNSAGEGNDIFDQTTQAMVDMAQAMGTDPKAAAMTLGKALNDPIKGLSALGRVGIQFTDQQKDQIKAMQEAGDTAGAQKLILGELNKQFGGSGAAAAATFEGKLFQVKNVIDGLAEELITKAMPAIETLTGWLADNLPGAIATVSEKFTQLSNFLAPVVNAIGQFVGFLADNPETVRAFAITLGILGGIIGIVTAAQWLWNIAMTANPIGLIVLAIALLVAAIVFLVTHFDQIKAKAAEVWGKMWTATKDAFGGMVSTVRDGIGSAVGWVAGLPGRARSSLSTLGSTLGTAATDAGRRLVDGTTTKITEAVTWLAGLPGRAKGAVGDLGRLLWGAGADIVNGLIGGLDSMVDVAMDKARNLASNLGDAAKSALGIKSPSRVFAEIGRQTGEGLILGLGSTETSVTQAGRGMIDGLNRGIELGDVDPINLPVRGSVQPGTAPAPIEVHVHALDPTPEIIRRIVAIIRDAQRTGLLT